MSPRRLVLVFLGALTLFRLVLIAQFELTPDEAYYFQWSEHLDFSYFSKGPGVALAIWLTTHLFGANEFGVRALAPLLALGTSLLMAGFARRLYGEQVALWTVLLMNCTPIFNAGSLLMTIDPLSIFFWTAALYTCWLALEKSPAFSAWWPATGALIGLGFLAKYTAALQLLSIVLLLAFTPNYRRELRLPGFYAMLGVFALCTIPVLVWNAQHDWITLNHLRERGGLDGGASFRPGEFFKFLGLHFAVYSPLIFGAMCGALWWVCRSALTRTRPRFLAAFTLPIFVIYFGLAFKHAGEPNWTAPGVVSLAILTAALGHEFAPRFLWGRRYASIGLALGVAMSLLTLDVDMLRRAGIPLPYELDTTGRLRGWRTASEQIHALRKRFEAEHGAPVFLIANKYGTAAALAFYLPEKRAEGPGHPPIYCPESPFVENQFSFWPRYDANSDFTETARELLRPGAQPVLEMPVRDELAAALSTITGGDATKNPLKQAENRRRFLRALKAAAPALPIDEYYTESLGYSQFLGRTAFYITDRPEQRPASGVERGFAKWELIACLDIKRRDLPLRQLRVFACYDYHQVEL